MVEFNKIAYRGHSCEKYGRLIRLFDLVNIIHLIIEMNLYLTMIAVYYLMNHKSFLNIESMINGYYPPHPCL